ncbi:MAG: Signal peptidase IB [Candidatus Heimdallarchaeota archaeon LC_3]|nr:MAG: Signal peptidase IB [Candidatus Heimdallarchaeota archaeon LC_3]
MFPTIKDSDILVIKKCKKNTEIVRGDIVAFYRFIETSKLFIKRVIGLPNETIIWNSDGKIFVDNTYLDEPYALLQENTEHKWDLIEDSYLVLGDNRRNSEDGRKFGPLFRQEIIGKVIFSLKPFEKMK